MSSLEHRNILNSLTAVQTRFRELPENELGCRLLHWDPQLETENRGVYFPLNTRIHGRPKILFGKVYKVKYAVQDQLGSGDRLAERQYGITYISWHENAKAALNSFVSVAADAGGVLGTIRHRLASALPAATLAAKNDMHRWIFTLFDLAWMDVVPTPLRAFKYIPITGFDEAMVTDESVLYDLDQLRSHKPKKRFPRRSSFAHLAEPYAAWSQRLPEYYASRIDDVVRASVWAVDYLMKQAEEPGMANDAGGTRANVP